MPFSAEQVLLSRHGGPEELYLETVELPDPANGEVVVRQDAIGVNFLDIYHRRGDVPIGPLPAGIGVEAAGVIEAVGAGVKRLKVGDRVTYAGPPVGSYATRRVLPETILMRLPAGLSNEIAAAATLRGMTAHMLMTRIRPLRYGNTVLVHNAAGGLGLLIVQWAKSLGARVIGTVGSPEKAELARSMGTDSTIMYKDDDFVSAVKDLTGGAGVDVVYEGMGGETLKRSLALIKPFGLAVNLGNAGGVAADINVGELGPMQSLAVSVPGVSVHLRTVPDLQAAGDELFERIVDGTLKVHVGARFPLSRAADAQRLIESGGSSGSIVLYS